MDCTTTAGRVSIRKGFYKDKGKPAYSIVSVMELVKAVVAIVIQRPDDARARGGDYIRNDEQYEIIFGKDTLPLGAFASSIKAMKRVEDYLDGRSDLEKGHDLNCSSRDLI
jgi:hypothetical protein